MNPDLLALRQALCLTLGWLDDEGLRLAVRDLIERIDERRREPPTKKCEGCKHLFAHLGAGP